jgi:hypothetical protein
MMRSDRFVAVGLLTRRDLDVLGSGFRRAFPLNKSTDFTSLLIEIDRAERDGEDRQPRAFEDGRRALLA